MISCIYSWSQNDSTIAIAKINVKNGLYISLDPQLDGWQVWVVLGGRTTQYMPLQTAGIPC